MSQAAPNPTANDGPPVRRWLARAWTATRLRVVGAPRPSLYAFGKHPAFADFIDVGRLPPVPGPFRHFHDVLRPAVERGGGPAGPVLIGWRERGVSAVLWVVPSRDRGDEVTGRFRRCPLLLGATAAVSLADLLRQVGGRLAGLADEVLAADADGVFERIGRAAAEWPTAGDAGEPEGIVGRAVAALLPAGDPSVFVARGAEVRIERIGLSTLSAADLAGWLGQREDEATGP